jgi:chemotaxis protein methyltransferase CheR
MVYGRLARRLRALGLTTFADYLSLVEQPDSPETGTFINALTTNVTEFLRERHHFDFLAQRVLPQLRKELPRGRRLRIWSAGCSTGEEPYTMAMVLRESGELAGWDVRILATDIDSDVLGFASAGVYPAERAERIPTAWRERHFERQLAGGSRRYQARPHLRSLITFKRLNLLEGWPMKGPFDAIFCRNVIIYFDNPTKLALIRRFHQMLGAGGFLFLGHSESLASAGLEFDNCGRTAYRKAEAA